MKAGYIQIWKADFLQGVQVKKTTGKADLKEAQADKKEIKQLKRELRRKEKALAETAALLVLRKKLNAFWDDNEES